MGVYIEKDLKKGVKCVHYVRGLVVLRRIGVYNRGGKEDTRYGGS